MIVIAKNNKVVEAFYKDQVNMKVLIARYPAYSILESNTIFPPELMSQLARIYDGQVVKKPSVLVFLDKKRVVADGIDEVEIRVEIVDCQPGEIINEIRLKIDEVIVPLELEDNKGSILFSTKIKGLHIISIDSSDVLFMEECVLAI